MMGFEWGQCGFTGRTYLKKVIQQNQIETLDRGNNSKYEEQKTKTNAKNLTKNFKGRVERVGKKLGDPEDRAAEIEPDQDAQRQNSKQKWTDQRSAYYSQTHQHNHIGSPEWAKKEKWAEKKLKK